MSIADKIKDKVVDIGKKYLEEKAKSLSSETKFLFEMWEEMGELSKLTKDDISVDQLKKKALDLSSKIFKQINIITALTTEASKNHAIDNDFKKRLDTITSTLTEITKDTKVLAEKSGVEKTVLDVVDTLVVVAKTSGDLKSRAENLLQLSQGTLLEGKNDPAIPEIFTGCLDDVEQSSNILSGSISGLLDIAKEEIQSVDKEKLKDTIQEKLAECVPNINRVTGMVAKTVATAPVETVSDEIVSLLSAQTESIPEVTKPVVTQIEIDEEFQTVFKKQNETADFAGNIVGNAEIIKDISNTCINQTSSNTSRYDLKQVISEAAELSSAGNDLIMITEMNPMEVETDSFKETIADNCCAFAPAFSGITTAIAKTVASELFDKALASGMDRVKEKLNSAVDITTKTAKSNNTSNEIIGIIHKQLDTAENTGKMLACTSEILDRTSTIKSKTKIEATTETTNDMTIHTLEMESIVYGINDLTKEDPSLLTLQDYQERVLSQGEQLETSITGLTEFTQKIAANETDPEIIAATGDINERNSKVKTAQDDIKTETLAPIKTTIPKAATPKTTTSKTTASPAPKAKPAEETASSEKSEPSPKSEKDSEVTQSSTNQSTEHQLHEEKGLEEQKPEKTSAENAAAQSTGAESTTETATKADAQNLEKPSPENNEAEKAQPETLSTDSTKDKVEQAATGKPEIDTPNIEDSQLKSTKMTSEKPASESSDIAKIDSLNSGTSNADQIKDVSKESVDKASKEKIPNDDFSISKQSTNNISQKASENFNLGDKVTDKVKTSGNPSNDIKEKNSLFDKIMDNKDKV